MDFGKRRAEFLEHKPLLDDNEKMSLPAAEATAEPEDTEFSFDKLKPKIKPIYKVLFVIGLLICIGTSLYLSFNSVSLTMYEYETDSDGLHILKGFNNNSTVTELNLNYVMEQTENGWVESETPLSYIKSYALCGDESVEIINIGANVLHIDYQAFYDCQFLKAINVDENNENYCSVDGVLYNKDKTELMVFPEMHTSYEFANLEKVSETEDGVSEYKYTILDTVTSIAELAFTEVDHLLFVDIPDSVTHIGELAFFKCSDLKEINLPDNLETLGSDAFSYCKNITYIFIPKSVNFIGHHAFHECKGLTEINVERTESDFKENVETGSRWCPRTFMTKAKLFKVNIPINYGQERRAY